MVDIHTHILPGIDDGARHWKDSYRMAAIAADSAVDTIVCSHHANIPGTYENYNSSLLDEIFEEMEDRLRRGHFPVHIVRGMEIFCTPDVVEKIDAGMLLPINGTNYYLVEFDFYASPEFMEDILFDIRDLGKTPVIAHPERYIALQNEPDLLYDWMKHGMLTQINKGSLSGFFGNSCQSAAEIFMEHHMVTCIASDAHRADVRTTDMSRTYLQVRKEYSKELARKLFEVNPRRIVEGKKIVHGDLIPFEK